MLQKDLTKKLLILSAKDETKMVLLKEIKERDSHRNH